MLGVVLRLEMYNFWVLLTLPAFPSASALLLLIKVSFCLLAPCDFLFLFDALLVFVVDDEGDDVLEVLGAFPGALVEGVAHPLD
jgi:hypothetical protein